MKKFRINTYRILFGLMVLSLVSCGGVKSSSSGKINKLYETFFVGEEGIQYFIKPITLGEDNIKAVADFTFRSKTNIQATDSATINISIFSSNLYKKLDKIFIQNENGDTVTLFFSEHMFSEKTKKGFVSRFSLKAQLEQLSTIFEGDNWQTFIYPTQDEVVKLSSTSKANKKITRLDSSLFALIR